MADASIDTLPAAVRQALQTSGAFQAATASSPEAKALTAASGQASAANDAAADTVRQSQAKRSEILDEMRQDKVPDAPKLQDAPKAPPEEAQTDPLRVFQQFIPLLAAFGSATVKNGAVTSLNSATAAMTAAKSNDQQALERAHQKWMDDMQVTLHHNQTLMDQYRAVMDKKNMDRTQQMAELQGIAAANGDATTLANLSTGNLANLQGTWKVLDEAGSKLQSVYDKAQDRDLERKKFAADQSYRQQELGLRREEIARQYAGLPPATQAYDKWMEQHPGDFDGAANAAGQVAAKLNVSKAASTEKGIRQELEKSPLGKAYSQVDQFGRVIQDAKDKIEKGIPLSNIEQTGVMDAYQKIITGGNAIRGFQMKMATEHGSLLDKANVAAQQLGRGGLLSPQQLKDIVSVTDEYTKGMEEEYNSAVQRGIKQAESLGLPGDSVLPFSYNPPANNPAVALPPSAVKELHPGTITTFKNGTRWTLGPDGQPTQVQ